MLEFRCEACNERLFVPEGHSGRKIKCPKCKGMTTVPGLGKISLIKKCGEQPVGSQGSLVSKSSTRTNNSSLEVDSEGKQKIFFSCSKCGEDLEVPNIFKGKSVVCPACNVNVSVPNQGNIDNQQPVYEDEIQLVEAVRQCPSCGETILDIAKKCKHCGEFTGVPNYGGMQAKNSNIVLEEYRSMRVNNSNSKASGSDPESSCFCYAGFWRRVFALLIDILILAALSGIVGFLIGAVVGLLLGVAGIDIFSIQVVCGFLGNILGLILNWLYFTLSESGDNQATLGKRAVGIIVTDLDGKPISFGKANSRYWSKIISGLILGIGYLMAAFTRRRQALHDFMSGCLVIKKG